MKLKKYLANNFIIFSVIFSSVLLFFSGIAFGENILENSSFEIGASHGWGLSTSYEISGPLDQFDSTTSYHGNSSLKLEFSNQTQAQSVISKIYKLKPNTQYTISFYAKSNFSDPVIIFQMLNTFQSPYGPGDTIGPFSFTASSNWKRFSFTGTTANSLDKCSYQLKFWLGHQGVSNEYIWVDAIQVEEGELTDYMPSAPVEVGLRADAKHQGNVFFEDEYIIVKLKQYNSDTETRSVTTNFEVFDYFNRKVKSGIVTTNIPPQSISEKDLNLTLDKNKRGAFRVAAWVKGVNGTMDELNYSVLPRPKVQGINENSIFGSHVPFKEYFLSVMQKVGIKWNRTLSTGTQFRWNVIEPTKGNFIWKDEEIDLAARYGMTVYGTIGSEIVHVPAWALDGTGLPKLDEWETFVSTVVNHYKDKVDYWEIWNEPEAEGGLKGKETFYAQLLQTAYNAAKTADPNCTIIGMVTWLSYYMEDVFSAIGDGYLDYISTHMYPPTKDDVIQRVIDVGSNHNKIIWNSETGMKTDSFYQTVFWEDLWNSYAQPDDWGRNYDLRTDWLVWNFARTVGRGLEKYFYYDARHTTAPDNLITFSLFEWDGTLRPKAVAFSVLANLFEGAKGYGAVFINPEIESYLLIRGTTPLIIMWNKNTSDIKKVSGTFIKVYDVMGHELSTKNGVSLGQSPIYIEGQGITKDQLINSIIVSDAPDVTPPNLSIVTYPTGPTEAIEGGMLFRWFAVDDVSISTRWELTNESILFSHKLDGYDSNWSSWDTSTAAIYKDVPIGNYIFRVKAKDQAGNISTAEVIVGYFGGSLSPPRNIRIKN